MSMTKGDIEIFANSNFVQEILLKDIFKDLAKGKTDETYLAVAHVKILSPAFNVATQHPQTGNNIAHEAAIASLDAVHMLKYTLAVKGKRHDPYHINDDIKTKATLTTGDIAKLCCVAPRTVSKWFDSGALNGYRIATDQGDRGDHRRVPRENLVQFMQKHKMPIKDLFLDIDFLEQKNKDGKTPLELPFGQEYIY